MLCNTNDIAVLVFSKDELEMLLSEIEEILTENYNITPEKNSNIGRE